MRYIIELSYNGSEFHGWQIQPHDRSVQQTLEEALSMLLKSEIHLTGAGRTDTSVNALKYLAHFDSDTAFDSKYICYKLNAILPQTIVIHSIKNVADDFHIRFDTKSRKYTYYIHRMKDPFMTSFSYLCAYPELDFEKMNKAASYLIGTHNFSCFEKLGADNKTSICSVKSAFWSSYTPSLSAWSSEDYYWKFTIEADRFLRNMVRAIVGTLLEVGRGKRSLEDFASLILPQDAIKQNNRSKSGESVPGHALFLDKISYL